MKGLNGMNVERRTSNAERRTAAESGESFWWIALGIVIAVPLVVLAVGWIAAALTARLP